MIVQSKVLNQFGKPFTFDLSTLPSSRQRIAQNILTKYSSYDATKNGESLIQHWQNTDRLGPNASNSYSVRQSLRSRSRYEVIENNPYLKGMILTLANDFVGSGPKLEITDNRLSREQKQHIQRQFQRWSKKFKLRAKLWRMKIAKVVDGETFSILFENLSIPFTHQLDNKIIEPEMITTDGTFENADIDGIKIDQFGNPTSYYILNYHPGDVNSYRKTMKGSWTDSKQVLHWFRQERGWARGIPETTPSLPLCALLRRYTLAVVKASEVAADFAAVLESEAPPTANSFLDGVQDDPFDQFPITQGMFTVLPWGYKLGQLQAAQPHIMYDQFVGSLLREIARPLLIPFNFVIGSSKDSNMASAVVDAHIYREGGKQERYSCEEEVLEPMFDIWWKIARSIPNYLTESTPLSPDSSREPPDHRWRWDKIGLDHTDPQKVANAIIALRTNNLLTDEDIQEEYYNRDVEDWQDNIARDNEFRNKIKIPVNQQSQPAFPEKKPPEDEGDDE